MIEVKIPKEIKEYEEKFIFGFPFRQTISIFLSGIISIVIYKFFENSMTIDSITTLIILFILPVFALGFIKYEGLTLDRYLYLYFVHLFIIPPNRKYSEVCVLDSACKEANYEYELAMYKYRKFRKTGRKRKDSKDGGGKQGDII